MSDRSFLDRWARGLAVLLLAGLPAAAAADDHGNSPGQATPLSPGVAVQGEVTSDDEDFFAFAAAAGQRFVLEAAGDPWIIVLAANGATTLSAPSASFEAQAHYAVLPPRAGVHFIQVRRPFGASTVSYQLLLRPVAGDQGETRDTATPVAPGDEFLGNGDFPNDVDMFRIAAVAGERLQVSLLDVPADLAFTITLSDETRTFFTHLPQGGNFSFPILPEATGPLFLGLRPRYKVPAGSYRLRVARAAADDHPESPAGATVLTPGGPALASTLDLEDRDFFAVDAVAGQLFLIKINSRPVFPRQGFFTQLLDPDGQVLAPLQSRTSLTFRAGRDGRHFLSVRSLLSQRQAALYDIALSAPIQEDHGDVPATATPVEVDGPGTAGDREHVEDVDVFSFTAAAGERLELAATGVDAGSDPLLTLLDGAGATLAEDDDSAGNRNARLEFTFPAAGTYFARVTPSTGSYLITVRRVP